MLPTHTNPLGQPASQSRRLAPPSDDPPSRPPKLVVGGGPPSSEEGPVPNVESSESPQPAAHPSNATIPTAATNRCVRRMAFSLNVDHTDHVCGAASRKWYVLVRPLEDEGLDDAGDAMGRTVTSWVVLASCAPAWQKSMRREGARSVARAAAARRRRALDTDAALPRRARCERLPMSRDHSLGLRALHRSGASSRATP